MNYNLTSDLRFFIPALKVKNINNCKSTLFFSLNGIVSDLSCDLYIEVSRGMIF